MSQEQDDDLSHNYQWIDSKRIPKWITASSSSVLVSKSTKPNEATPRALSNPQSIPRRLPTLRRPESDSDWSLVTSASGTEENGTLGTCAAQQEITRKECQKTCCIEQKARRKEQREINKRTAREQKELEARQRRMRQLSSCVLASNKVEVREKYKEEQRVTKRFRFGWLGKLLSEVQSER